MELSPLGTSVILSPFSPHKADPFKAWDRSLRHGRRPKSTVIRQDILNFLSTLRGLEREHGICGISSGDLEDQHGLAA